MTLKPQIFAIIFITLTLSFCTQVHSDKQQPLAKKGVLDLRDWNFKKDGSITLDGDWEFYWNEFVAPDTDAKTRKHFIKVPASWNQQISIDGKMVKGIGYGTYKLTILLSNSHPELSMKLLSFGTAYRLYANKQVIVNGKVAISKDEMIPYALPQVATFRNSSRKIEIVLHISNYHHKHGGFWNSIKLGDSKLIQLERDRLVAVDLIIAGCLIIMALYHFSIYLMRTQDKSALNFSLVGILFAVRTLMTDEKYLLHLFPGLPWELTFGLEYITIYLGFPFYIAFYRSVYPDEFSAKVQKVIEVIFFSLSVLVIVTPASVFSETWLYVQILMVLVGVYALYTLIIAIRRKREAAKIFLLGLLILFATVINDFLFNAHLIDSGDVASYGLLIFIFSQSFVLSIRYAKSFSKVEELSETLEKRVEERTAEISHQNLELEKQKSEIIKKNEIIERKNHNITASINYASRIQQAILGSKDAITSNFKDSFILLEPRDIVSGDFYWYTEVRRSKTIKETDERRTIFFKVIVAADCTGHGIPGAFMTVMGNALLDEIINENKVTNPSRILSVLDRKLLMKLRQHNVNDGMDMAILIFDDESRKVIFAGANNPLYYVRDNEMYQVRGSKFPIGSLQYKNKKKFEAHTIDYKEGDRFYIFSDGYQDQFGGEQGRKYYKKHFRQLLLDISHLPMEEQKEKLHQEFLDWKGNNSQTDDILVIGIQT